MELVEEIRAWKQAGRDREAPRPELPPVHGLLGPLARGHDLGEYVGQVGGEAPVRNTPSLNIRFRLNKGRPVL